MKIVFGLGNVGREYDNTRHNMGFMFLDYLYPNISYKKKFDGMYAEVVIDNEKILLVKPCKYMNLSGEVVSSYIDYYKVGLDDILVIHDDLDMNLGTFKLTYNHSSGGHNGMKSIIQMIGTEEFPRIRIGIGRPAHSGDEINHVIGAIPEDEIPLLDKGIEKAKDAVIEILKNGVDIAMNKFN